MYSKKLDFFVKDSYLLAFYSYRAMVSRARGNERRTRVKSCVIRKRRNDKVIFCFYTISNRGAIPLYIYIKKNVKNQY